MHRPAALATLVGLSLLAVQCSARLEPTDYVLVLNKSSDTLSFVNVETMETEESIPVGSLPHEMGFHPDGRTLYVSNVGANSISVIDLTARREITRIESPDFRFPHGIIFTPDGETALVTSEQANKIVIVDAARHEVLGSIDTEERGTHMVALSPDSRWAYFANRETHSVTVLDMEAAAIVTTIAAGEGAEGIAVSPDGLQVWVGDRAADTVTVIDTARRTAVATLPTGDDPKRVAFSPDGRHVFVPTGDDTVWVYDAATREALHQVAVSGNPGGVLVSPDGRTAFVACGRDGRLDAIDTETMRVVASIAVERNPDGVGYWAN